MDTLHRHPPELGPSDTQELDPQTFQELAALPDSIIINMNDLPTFQQGDFRDAFHQSPISIQHSDYDNRSIIQRGIRAIFLGFPLNQAGYIYWQPNTGDLGTSVDVSLDEYFHSPPCILRPHLP